MSVRAWVFTDSVTNSTFDVNKVNKTSFFSLSCVSFCCLISIVPTIGLCFFTFCEVLATRIQKRRIEQDRERERERERERGREKGRERGRGRGTEIAGSLI